MRITADTNLLVRAFVDDDAAQSAASRKTLLHAELVAIPLPALCEFVWVLARGYRLPLADIAAAIRRLAEASNVALNRPATEAGLAMLDAGGDFADGVIAYEGNWLGGETFVSFDRAAVAKLKAAGLAAQLAG